MQPAGWWTSRLVPALAAVSVFGVAEGYQPPDIATWCSAAVK
jgi:hypothetical protein